MIVAFRVPEAAKRFKASIGEDVHGDVLFKKPIAAGPGDHVCLRSLEPVDLNGIRIARNSIRNGIDRLQPLLWKICRPLTQSPMSGEQRGKRMIFDQDSPGL